MLESTLRLSELRPMLRARRRTCPGVITLGFASENLGNPTSTATTATSSGRIVEPPPLDSWDFGRGDDFLEKSPRGACLGRLGGSHRPALVGSDVSEMAFAVGSRVAPRGDDVAVVKSSSKELEWRKKLGDTRDVVGLQVQMSPPLRCRVNKGHRSLVIMPATTAADAATAAIAPASPLPLQQPPLSARLSGRVNSPLNPVVQAPDPPLPTEAEYTTKQPTTRPTPPPSPAPVLLARQTQHPWVLPQPVKLPKETANQTLSECMSNSRSTAPTSVHQNLADFGQKPIKTLTKRRLLAL